MYKRALFGMSLKISTYVTGGAREVRLKPKAQFSYDSADRHVFLWSRSSRFNVSTTFWMRRSHKLRGEFIYQLDSPSMRWALNVWISLSAIMYRCKPGDTRWCVTPLP